MSRVRWEEQQQAHLIQGGDKGVHHHRDAFHANNGVYGASAAARYMYRHVLNSSYSSTGNGVAYSPGYGVGSYGARRGAAGAAMKREEDGMCVSLISLPPGFFL